MLIENKSVVDKFRRKAKTTPLLYHIKMIKGIYFIAYTLSTCIRDQNYKLNKYLNNFFVAKLRFNKKQNIYKKNCINH